MITIDGKELRTWTVAELVSELEKHRPNAPIRINTETGWTDHFAITEYESGLLLDFGQ